MGNGKTMEQLQNYCIEVNDIDGIKTYIISPDLLDHLIADVELLSALSTSFEKIKHFVGYAKANTFAIFFGFAHFSNRRKSYAWQPINCYKSGSVYYHVAIRKTWVCRECKQIQHGMFIMPMVEHESIFYSDTDNKYPEIPLIFKKRVCENCGKPLQKHFLSLEQELNF